MVRDEDFAWAQGVRRKDLVLPRPSWWRDEYISYNACMLSIEIEGYAREIGRTFQPGSRQFETVAAWSAHVCRKYGIPIDRTHHVGHSELTRQKSDPGRDFPWAALLERVAWLSGHGDGSTAGNRTAAVGAGSDIRTVRRSDSEPNRFVIAALAARYPRQARV